MCDGSGVDHLPSQKGLGGIMCPWCAKNMIYPPLDILTSTMTKNQLKNIFKKKVSSYWYSYFCSLCPTYSSLKFFNFSKLHPVKPHPYVVNSGTSDYVNMKTSTTLKLLCGHYRLNTLTNEFNNWRKKNVNCSKTADIAYL